MRLSSLSSLLISSGAAALLLSALPAQGTYTTFGSGCPSGVCESSNPTGGTLASAQNSNIFALRVPPSSNLRVVTGFELYTGLYNTTTPLTITTEIYGADTAGAPTGSPLATGNMVIFGGAGWYKTTFTTPLIVQPNTTIFLSYGSVASQMYFPFVSSGNLASHFWHPQTATTWNGTPPLGFQTVRWAWKLNCGSGGAPSLSNTGVPTLGTTFSVDLSSAPANAGAIFAIGVSNTAWGSIGLPFDLSVLNAPGCNLYVSLEFQFLVTTTAAGGYSFSLSIPNDSRLKGFHFYNQYGVGSPTANPFGVAFSNAGDGQIN
ncbi:MAG: hypothetical protein H6836_10530 [Planctomycetes bacterium]|nr:hypothetical protein [Planctomycetota bacterium]